MTQAMPPEQTPDTEERVPVRDVMGGLGTLPASQVEAALASSKFTLASQAELDQQRAKDFAGSNLQQQVGTFVEGAGNTLLAPLGLLGMNYSDMIRAGLSPEEQARIAEETRIRAQANPGLSQAGSLVAMAATAPLLGGVGGLAEQGAARGLQALGVAGRGAGLLGRTAGYVLPRVASEAVQGAALGGTQYLSESALENHAMRGEELGQAMLFGGLMGGGLGLGLGLAGAAGREASGAVRSLFDVGTPSALGDTLARKATGAAEALDRRVQAVVDANREHLEAFAGSRAEKGLGGMMKENAAFERLSPQARTRADQMILEDMPARAGKRVLGKEEQLTIARQLKGEAGTEIGSTLKQFDAIEPKAVDVSELSNRIRGLEKDFATAGMEAEQNAIRSYARKLERAYGTFAEDGTMVEARTSLEELHKARARLDKEIYDLGGQKKGAKADALRSVRQTIEGQIEKDADRIAGMVANDTGLVGAYQKAKIDYGAASVVERAAERGVKGLTTNRTAGLGEHLSGLAGGFVGSLVGGPVGSVAGMGIGGVGGWLAKHYGDQALAQAAHQLAHGTTIREIASAYGQQMRKGVQEAFGAAGLHLPGLGQVARGALESGQRLLGSAAEVGRTALDTTVKGAQAAAQTSKIASIKTLTPKQFEAVSDEIRQRQQDPSIVVTEVMGTGLPHTHPSVAKQAVASQQAAIDYLASILPPQRTVPSIAGPKTLPVSEQDRERFTNAFKAVMAPETVLADLKDNKLSPESVAAFRAAWPQRFADLQTTVMQGISEANAEGKEIPYDRLVGFGLLLDITTDPTMDPGYIRSVTMIETTPGQGGEPQTMGQRRASAHIPGQSKDLLKSKPLLQRITPTQRRNQS